MTMVDKSLQAVENLFEVPELFHFKTDENQLDDSILPTQLPTTSKQTTELTFSSGQHDSPSVLVKLTVDASPGCGGITWPAGSVSTLLPNVLTSYSNFFSPSFFTCESHCLYTTNWLDLLQSFIIGPGQLPFQSKNFTRAHRRRTWQWNRSCWYRGRLAASRDRVDYRSRVRDYMNLRLFAFLDRLQTLHHLLH